MTPEIDKPLGPIMETAHYPQVVPMDPLALIASAIQSGMSPEALGKLVDLQERIERNAAAKGFSEALARFQARCPQVFKASKAHNANYAAYEDIMEVVSPVLSECGLALSFGKTSVSAGILNIECLLRWGIHVESHEFTVPVPREMKVNETQQFGAAVTYAKRYALCAVLNIVTSKEDNDANFARDTITPEQAEELTALIKATGSDLEKFLLWGGGGKVPMESVADLPAQLYANALSSLRKRMQPTPKPEKQATIPGTEPVKEQP